MLAPSSAWRTARAVAGGVLALAVTCLTQSSFAEPVQLTPLQRLKGHQNAVYAVALSPDGSIAATGSFDQSLRLWDVRTGKELRSYAGAAGHQGLVLGVAFSPSGEMVASAGADNTARVWDVPLSKPVREFAADKGVNAVAATGDGKRFAAACRDGTVKLWSTTEDKPFGAMQHESAANCVSFTSNNAWLVSGAASGSIRFWGSDNQQLLGEIGAHSGSVLGVVANPANNVVVSAGQDGLLKWWQAPPAQTRHFPAHGADVLSTFLSADGNHLLTAGADGVLKWSNAANGQMVREFQGGPIVPRCLALSPNNALIAAGGADGKLSLWKSDDPKVQAQLYAHPGGINGLAFHPTQPLLATMGADGTLRTWKLPLAAPRSINVGERVLASAVSCDGKRLFTAGPDKIVRAWTVATGAMERQFTGHDQPVAALDVSPDGNTLISAAGDGIRFWNTANGSQTGQMSGHDKPITALSSSANMLVSAAEDGAVKFWQFPPVAAKPFVHPEAIHSMGMAADGSRFTTVGEDRQARVWNPVNGQVERAFGVGSGAISATAFSSDANSLAVASNDKSVRIFNNGKETQKWTALPAVVQSLAFSPDQTILAAGLSDHSLRLFKIADGKEIKNIGGHTGPVTGVAFSAKGDLVFSAANDKSIRWWSAADGSPKGQVAHTAEVTALALNKEATRLAAAGADKSIVLWDLPGARPITTIHAPSEVRALALSADGQRLGVAAQDGRARVYSTAGELLETFTHEGAVNGLAYFPDSKRLITSSMDKTARLWTSNFLHRGRHDGPVRACALNQAGDRAFTVGDDRQFKIWDAKNGNEVKSIAAHGAGPISLDWCAPANKLVTTGTDKLAKIWSGNDGNLLTTIALPNTPRCAALSADGTRVVIAFEESKHRIKCFDATSGADLQDLFELETRPQSVHFLTDNSTVIATGSEKAAVIGQLAVQQSTRVCPEGAVGVVFHPNGTQILTGGNDRRLKLWDITTNKEAKSFGPTDAPIGAIAASRDFTIAAAAAGKSVRIWQTGDGKELASITHPADILSFAFNADRTRIITGAADKIARVWDTATGRLLQTYNHNGPVRGVAFHPNQPLVFTSADKNTVANALSLTRLTVVSAQPIRAIAQTPNASHIITAGDDRQVKAWNIGTGAEERSFAGAEGPVYAVAVSKNAAFVAAGGADKKIRLYTNDARLVGTLDAPGIVRALAFHPTLPVLCAACGEQGVQAWRIISQPAQPLPPEFGALIQSFPSSEASASLTISDQGALITGNERSAKLWRMASDAAVRSFQHPALVDSVAFDHAGKQLATGCHDGVVRIFDIEKNNVTRSIDAHRQNQPEQRVSPIYSVVWAPDDKQLLTASHDQSAKLWDVASGKMIREFKPFMAKTFEKGHRDQIFTAVFTKDAQLLATGSSDRMIKLWKVDDGTVVREFANPKLKQLPDSSPEAHPGWIYSLCYSADEKTLYSAGSAPRNRGYLAAWNVADGRMLYGEELASGPVYSIALSKDGAHLLLGCGPEDRQMTASEAVVVPVPK